MKEKFYRNSDLKINKYFSLPQFKEQIIEAKKHGKDVFYNQIRILNNCYYARKLQGDISIKDIFKVYWNDFKDKFKQYRLLNNVYNFFKNIIKDRELTHEIYLLNKSLLGSYKDGFYVYGSKFNNFNTTTFNMKTLTNYITRYASHPPISKRRIISINDDNLTITWFYDSNEDDDVKDEELKLGKQIITENIFSFMSKLIIHIPDKKFQIIRYYGFYANRFINKFEDNLLCYSTELKK